MTGLTVQNDDASPSYVLHVPPHTLGLAFRHLPPNSARFGYVTEGALYLSAQLSTKRCQLPPKRFGTNNIMSVEATQSPFTHKKVRRVRSGWKKEEEEKKKGSVSIQAISVLFVMA